MNFSFIREDLSPGNLQTDQFYFMIAATKGENIPGVELASMPNKMFFYFRKNQTFELIVNPKHRATIDEMENDARMFPITTEFGSVVEIVFNQFYTHYRSGWNYTVLLKRRLRENAPIVQPIVEQLTHIFRL